MKILIVIDDFIHSNGVARANYNLTKEWIKNGHKVSVLTFRYDNFTDFEVKLVKRFIFANKENIIELKNVIDRINPDIIFCNAGMIAYPVSKNYSTICRYGGSFPYDLLYTFFDGRKIFNWALMSHFIQFMSVYHSKVSCCPSNYFVKSNRYFFLKKFNLINNGIPIKKNKKSIRLGKNALLFIGEIRYSKGIIFLLRSFKRISEKIPSAKLFIIGRASNKNLLNKIENTSQVYYLGQKEDVFPYIKGCDIFIFPSYSENFSNVLLEAQAYGKPVVSFNTTGIPEVVKNNSSGFLVKKNDIKAFVDKTVLLLKNPKLAKKMGKNGRKFVQRFSWQKAGRQYLKIFNQFIKNKKE